MIKGEKMIRLVHKQVAWKRQDITGFQAAKATKCNSDTGVWTQG